MADGPSPEAIRRATLTICRILSTRHPGQTFVPADEDDPTGQLVVFHGEPDTHDANGPS